MKQIGIVLILIGLALSIFTAFTYFTEERVAKIGPMEVTREKPHSISWSPIVGVALIGIGGLVLWSSTKK